MLTNYPAWRIARDGETPGQLEPQLEEIEPTTHVLNEDHSNSYCRGAVLGDRAITLEQALDPDNDMYFNCQACYLEITSGVEKE